MTFFLLSKGIAKFISSTLSQCRSCGYIETLHGRRRYLPAIESGKSAQRSQAERQAVNTKIQGSAADLVKAAIILIDRSLSAFPNSRLVHQIHDELLLEVNNYELDQVAQMVQQSMETAIPMKIRLPVALKKGLTWGNMEVFQLNQN